MTNYVPHYTKKIIILQRKEESLRRLIERQAEMVLLIAQAIEVRDARIRVIRAKLATLPPNRESYGEQISRLEGRIAAAEQVDPRAILHEFGVPAAQFGENDSSPSSS